MKNRCFVWEFNLKRIVICFSVINIVMNSMMTTTSSYASDVPNRYQTLEGESITVDNPVLEILEEVEIFGNTIQENNSLEDIQSVGDLYVDEDGNPILDKLGRKQYEITISSKNDNLFDINTSNRGNLHYANGKVTYFSDAQNIVSDYIKLTNTKGLYFYSDILGENTNHQFYICFYDKNKTFLGYNQIQYIYFKERVYKPNPNTKYIRISYNPDVLTNLRVSEGGEFLKSYIKHESQTQTILLPTQLQKIGETYDKLFWDSRKNKYCIEKRIKYDDFTKGKIESQLWSGQIESINFHYRISDFFGSWSILRAYCNTLVSGVAKNHYGQDTVGFITDTGGIVIKLPRNELKTLDVDGCKEWLKSKDSYLYYVSKDTELIETNITSKLKIPVYKGKTYISTENSNNVSPALKVVIDKLPQIAKDSVDELESNPTSLNIARSRMYVNMLPESLYKDKLQEQLNSTFSSDIIFEKKNASSNLDVYIKSENMLSLSLNTNAVTFNDFSGVEDVVKENAVDLTVNSSLPYNLNAYLEDEIQNADKLETMDKSILNIKENGEAAYKEFSDTKIKLVLKDNCIKGNGINHNIDIKLKGSKAFDSDVYKTVIRFEIEQK